MRVARAFGKLLKLSDAMRCRFLLEGAGGHVVATLGAERALLDVALCGTAAHAEQIVRGWRRMHWAAEAAEDQRQHGRGRCGPGWMTTGW